MFNLTKVRRKLILQPVTIITALKFKDGVVVGSDGQTSFFPSTHKETDARKISFISAGESHAIIAQAGNADFGTRTVELITSKSAALKMDSPRAVANLVEDSISEIRQKTVFNHQGICSNADEFKQVFYENDFSILSVCIFDGKPHIHTASFYHGLSIQSFKEYTTLGCGSNIAQLLLCDLPVSQMTWKEALATTVYVIEKTKKHDSACGGQTYIATLNNDGSANQAGDGPDGKELIDQFERAFKQEEAQDKTSWKAKMMDMVTRVSKQRIANLRPAPPREGS
jgi:20S proteasome alpha/beta subunit